METMETMEAVKVVEAVEVEDAGEEPTAIGGKMMMDRGGMEGGMTAVEAAVKEAAEADATEVVHQAAARTTSP
jgi:hypothetical protein